MGGDLITGTDNSGQSQLPGQTQVNHLEGLDCEERLDREKVSGNEESSGPGDATGEEETLPLHREWAARAGTLLEMERRGEFISSLELLYQGLDEHEDGFSEGTSKLTSRKTAGSIHRRFARILLDASGHPEAISDEGRSIHGLIEILRSSFTGEREFLGIVRALDREVLTGLVEAASFCVTFEDIAAGVNAKLRELVPEGKWRYWPNGPVTGGMITYWRRVLFSQIEEGEGRSRVSRVTTRSLARGKDTGEAEKEPRPDITDIVVIRPPSFITEQEMVELTGPLNKMGALPVLMPRYEDVGTMEDEFPWTRDFPTDLWRQVNGLLLVSWSPEARPILRGLSRTFSKLSQAERRGVRRVQLELSDFQSSGLHTSDELENLRWGAFGLPVYDFPLAGGSFIHCELPGGGGIFIPQNNEITWNDPETADKIRRVYDVLSGDSEYGRWLVFPIDTKGIGVEFNGRYRLTDLDSLAGMYLGKDGCVHIIVADCLYDRLSKIVETLSSLSYPVLKRFKMVLHSIPDDLVALGGANFADLRIGPAGARQQVLIGPPTDDPRFDLVTSIILDTAAGIYLPTSAQFFEMSSGGGWRCGISQISIRGNSPLNGLLGNTP